MGASEFIIGGGTSSFIGLNGRKPINQSREGNDGGETESSCPLDC